MQKVYEMPSAPEAELYAEFDANAHPGDYSKLEVNLGYIGAAVRKRATTAGEQALSKSVTRTRMMPKTASPKLNEKPAFTPKQAVREIARSDIDTIWKDFANNLKAITAFYANEMAKISAEAQSAYASGAITQTEAKEVISKRQAELSTKRRVDVQKARTGAQQKIVGAVKDAKRKVGAAIADKKAAARDATLRKISAAKSRVAALGLMGQMDEDTVVAATNTLQQKELAIIKGAKAAARAVPAKAALSVVADRRKKIQALSAAISQAENVGATFVSFGDIQIDLEEARNRRLRLERELSDAEAKLARLNPTPKPAKTYSPINYDGRQLMPEELRAEMKYQLEQGNVDKARQIKYILDHMAMDGAPVRVDIHSVAIRESLPTGERFAVTRSGPAKTRMAPIPDDVPRAIQYATYQNKEE